MLSIKMIDRTNLNNRVRIPPSDASSGYPSRVLRSRFELDILSSILTHLILSRDMFF